MPDHYLMYWRFETIEDYSDDGLEGLLDHAASSQFGRVGVGDVLWIVTTPPQTRRLLLFGRMSIGWLGRQDEAAQILDTDPESLWQAEWHVIAPEGSAEEYGLADISGIAAELRFVSPTGRDRLEVDSQGVNPQQLQTLRQLAPSSVVLLDEIWYEGQEVTDTRLMGGEVDVSQIETYSEGRRRLRVHFQRERNARLVAEAKRHFKEIHGRLLCEVCGFDFGIRYGEIGIDFIEAHHDQALSELVEEVVETSVDDLAMVCSNCHRMLHRRRPWLTVEHLRTILESHRPLNRLA